MARTRTRSSRSPALAFDALTVEGSLIAHAMLARIAQHQAGGQTETDYGIPKGLTLRDEIARYFRMGQALFRELTASPTPSHAATAGFVEKLLTTAFGFTDIQRVGRRTVGDRTFTLTLEALGGRAPIVVVPPADDLDRPSDHLATDPGSASGAGGRRRSAASALQDWLNAHDGALWGLAANGLNLRLTRDNASLTRPAYIEADLKRVFEGEDFADFTALWLLLHASRFGTAGAPPSDCPLERWREAGQKEGVAARDKLRGGVEEALLSLGNGFLAHAENGPLRDKVKSGELPLPAYFGQLLRLVYRLIFLLAAEDRNLLHPPSASAAARKLYAQGYSVGLQRDRAVRRTAWDRHHDRWEGLNIAFRALARGEPRLGLPALDGLFAPGTIPDLEQARLANRSLMEAIYRLAWLKDDSALSPVNWRDMETEELGSVYESLLELTPQLTDDGRGFKFAEGGEGKGHARKTTGSYYTPDSLVQALLDSALDPVLDRVEAEASDPAAALLSVTVLDPACGSGHFLLAAARRIATRLARVRAGGNPAPADYRHALRDVARACIYGVDRNPMAVELTKVALWIETVEPGKPLGFLDANIRCGDSLFGLFDLKALNQGIPDAAYKPLAGDDRETAKHFEKRNKAERDGQGTLDFTGGGGKLPPRLPLAGEARALRAMPEDDPDQIAAKRKKFESARAEPGRWSLRVAADLYVAAFLTPKTGGVPQSHAKVAIPTTAHVWDALAARTAYGPLVGRAQDLAAEARAFHWPLEFPDIMAAGGFDVVLGNPPWERIKLQEQEFFAAREPEIAEASNAAARGRLIAALAKAEPGTRERALYDAFETAKRTAEAASVFARAPADDGGRFPLTGRGDVNTYALFAELAVRLKRLPGRAGIIVPSGIATDDNTKDFFSNLIMARSIDSILSFENEEFIFPSVHHSFKFALLTIAPASYAPRFMFYARRIADIRDARRIYTFTAKDIDLVNPNSRTSPLFRTPVDAAITKRIHARVPVLIRVDGGSIQNPWELTFTRMFDMANDSGLFKTAAQLESTGGIRKDGNWITDEKSVWLPLYEAKMTDQYDHRYADYSKRGGQRGHRVLPELGVEDHRNPARFATPFYWVEEANVRSALGTEFNQQFLFGYGRATTATTARTVVGTVFPVAGATDKTVIVRSTLPAPLFACFIANTNAIILDYICRQKISYLTLSQFIFQQLPFLLPSTYRPDDVAFIKARVIELCYTAHDLRGFALDLGYDGPPFGWDVERRAVLRAELDVYIAHLYGLTRDDLEYILDPSTVHGLDFPGETFRVLKNQEIGEFGCYRTRQLVLEAWDRLFPKK
jgi:hypothetical protein